MNGILIINKPVGCTSHDIVYKIKTKLNVKKVGHTGTLDPLASGVLPILLGDSTKLAQYIINHDKEYITTIKLGMKTDTGDLEGKIIEKKEVKDVLKEKVNEAIFSFIGKQIQTPPIYSAIKVKGKRLYEYARKNINVEIPKREIEIYSIKLLKFENDEITLDISCSKGTYIRTLCEDIANSLGNIGTMIYLQRIKVGDFNLKDAVEIDDLDDEVKLNTALINAEKFFANYESIDLEKELFIKFQNGVKIENKKSNGLYKIYVESKFMGIGKVLNNTLKREYIENNIML